MKSKNPYQLTYVYCRNKNNKYSYALNNPIRFTDPSGNDPDPIWSYHNGQYVKKNENTAQRERIKKQREWNLNNAPDGKPTSETDFFKKMDRMMMRIQERSSFVMKSMFNKQLEYQLQREILKILLEEKSVVPILNISSGKDKLVLLDEFNETDLAFDDIAGSDKTGAPSDEALATFTERMNILSHQWAKDAVANLEGAQGGLEDISFPTMPNNIKEGVEGSSIAFSATEKAAELSFGKANGIFKTFYVLGKATGLLSVYNDATNIKRLIDDPTKSPTWRDWGKLGTSLTFFGSNSINPLIPAGYFLLDISGYNPWEWGSNNPSIKTAR